ncbi:TetR/AcrR family transcriptional regulator [Pandoraea terrae]|uniref:TetR/AcrR family transcriptional regulator n=1 Tax=Pandoraea terrae TaxID=1537710 RepID=UPI00123FA1F2|nr:TetR/AcrR family transcriptional regulator [Pandoraea terrae]
MLKAAMRLLSTQGREGATSRAICAEAGVSAPTMYHHYGDLTGLHKAAIDETYVQVAEAYRRGAREKGPQQGLRAGWAMFNHFAREEPRMCRIVIQQILAGEPPSSVAGTLDTVAEDLESLHAQGLLNVSPYFAVQMLWLATLGSICFTAREDGDKALYPSLQNSMIDMILRSLFKECGTDEKVLKENDQHVRG